MINTARAFAAAGVEVHVVGATMAAFTAMPWPSITGVERHSVGEWRPGRVSTALALTAEVYRLARRLRPSWIWCSDPWSLPLAIPIARAVGARFAYQEHDSPPADPRGERWLRRAVRPLRRHALRHADVVVFPNARRLEIARQAAGKGCGRDFVVWNVPTRAEVPARAEPARRSGLCLHFHGSISPFALPLVLLDAMAPLPNVHLRIFGYTVGHADHLDRFRARAVALGIADRVAWSGALPRPKVLAEAGRADVGIAFFRPHPNNINHSHALGASNKVFDYLAAGLAVLVSEADEWHGTVVPDFGRTCDPESVPSIMAAIRGFLGGDPEPSVCGLAGRRRVLDEWHYERAFAPVIEATVP